MTNTKILQQIDDLIDKKQSELITLNQEKQSLQENMSDPKSIGDNAYKLEEKGREIAISLEARDYILDSKTDNVRKVFEELKQDFISVLENKISLDVDTTEEEKNISTINNIIASGDTDDPDLPNPSNEGQQNSNNDTDYSDTGNFDE